MMKDNNYILKVEHTPLHGVYGIMDDIIVPEAIVEEIPLTLDETIDAEGIEFKVLQITDDFLKLKLPKGQGVFSNYKVYQEGSDEIITLNVNERHKINRDILDCMEYWNITFINKKNHNLINQFQIYFKIVSNNNTYKLHIISGRTALSVKKIILTYIDSNNKVYRSNLNELMFKELKDKINKVTSNWKIEYYAENNLNVKWNLVQSEGNNIKEYKGVNAYPDNWNEFLDIMIFYEKVCKIESLKNNKINMNGIKVPYKNTNDIMLANPNQLYKAAIEGSVNKYLNINSNNNEIINNVKNLYRIILVCGEYENPIIDESNLKEFLRNRDKVINLIRKFKDINKNKFNNELPYLTFDINDNSLLSILIDILNESFRR